MEAAPAIRERTTFDGRRAAAAENKRLAEQRRLLAEYSKRLDDVRWLFSNSKSAVSRFQRVGALLKDLQVRAKSSRNCVTVLRKRCLAQVVSVTDFDVLGNGMGVKSRTHNVSFRHPTSPDLTVSGVASDAHDRYLRLTRLYTNQMALGTAPALAVDGAMFVLHARQPHMGYSSVKVRL
jgi:hypothetical protein